MKKIGIVTDVKYSGYAPKQEIIYKYPELNQSVLTELKVVIYDSEGNCLKKVSPNFGNKLYYRGNVVEYDDETNTVTSKSPLEELPTRQCVELACIVNQYKQLSEALDCGNRMDAIFSCSNYPQMKTINDYYQKGKEYFYKIEIEELLKTITEELKIRSIAKSFMNNENNDNKKAMQ